MLLYYRVTLKTHTPAMQISTGVHTRVADAVTELAARGRRSIAFDLPGLGSPTDRPRSTTRGPAWAASAWLRSKRSSSTASTSWCTTSAE
jgi:hypothetical protein